MARQLYGSARFCMVGSKRSQQANRIPIATPVIVEGYTMGDLRTPPLLS